jgi:hypothetical protein
LRRRAALELPLNLANETRKPVVLFIDELQRAVSYADGEGLVSDLVDIYAGTPEVVVLVDGSQERAVEQLMGAPYSLAKLTTRIALDDRIPLDQWRRPLRDRFAQADISISNDWLERLLAFGDGMPYPTMCAARHIAQTVRALGTDHVDRLAFDRGLEQARARIDDDL